MNTRSHPTFDIPTWAKLYQDAPPLTTEMPNKATRELSSLAEQDLNAALDLWKNIDLALLKKFETYLPQIQTLQSSVFKKTRTDRVFLVGCGSSGRLAYWMQEYLKKINSPLTIIAILAGGTGALIRSQEGVEDSFLEGKNALLAHQPTSQDVVIGLAASGRTPYVLGALEAAFERSASALLILNNPIKQVKPRLKNPEFLDQIHTLGLDVGPMALTGSTRLQATTALQLGLLILLDPEFDFLDFKKIFGLLDFQALAPLIQYESECLSGVNKNAFQSLKSHAPLEYQADPSCLLTVLADLTERAPTFSLPPISPSPSYSPWQIQTQNPNDMSAFNRLVGFELPDRDTFYQIAIALTSQKTETLPKIYLQNHQAFFILPETLPLAYSQLALKCLLNAHSTLVLGRLGYFRGNQMTHLSPSNEKLIDRAIRYALAYAPPEVSYTKAAEVALQLLNTPSMDLKGGASFIDRLSAMLNLP